MTRNGEQRRRAAEELAVQRHLARFGEAESLATPVWEQKATSVRAIADQLAELWSVPTAAGASDGIVTEKGMPHARASVLNLIVTVVDPDAAERAVAAMMALGVRHPSRSIVLVANPEARGGIDARISTHCNALGADGDRICYDEVVLTVRGEAARHLPGIVAPLLVHDLPTCVWWPGDPPFGDPVFEQLVEMADRLIVDSSDFRNLLKGYRRLATVRHRSGVGDLSWERLGWWQELTAQFFDAPRFRRYLPNLNGLLIRYAVRPETAARPRDRGEVVPGVASPITQAALYAGWVASRLGWKRERAYEPADGGRVHLRLDGSHEMVDLRLEPVATGDVAPGELVNVHLKALGETGAAEFMIDRSGDEAIVATNADGMTALLRSVRMEEPSESDLLSVDLVSERHDPVFESALRAALVFLDAARTTEARA